MNNEPTSLLSITGTETDQYTVSVEVLTRVLEGMQQLALIFAAANDGLTLQQRFKPSGELRRRFRLRVGVPLASSYALPMELVDEEPQQKLTAGDAIFFDGATEHRIHSASEEACTILLIVSGDEGCWRESPE